MEYEVSSLVVKESTSNEAEIRDDTLHFYPETDPSSYLGRLPTALIGFIF